MMTDAAMLDHDANWAGGFYELALELGPHDDVPLDHVLDAVWREAAIEGCFEIAEPSPLRHIEAERTLTRREVGHLRGIVRLPSGASVVCGAVAIRIPEKSDWFDLYLPLGALSKTDGRIGSFPFGDDGGPSSLAWRAPIDEWFRGVASRVFASTPFQLGLIGFEAAAEDDAESVARSAPDERYFGYLIPVDGQLTYYAANQ